MPGLPGNYLRATEQEWRIWNRRLRADLMSWHGFRVAARTGLAEPVPCELSIHHPYSRTIVHRVHDAAANAPAQALGAACPGRAGLGARVAGPTGERGERREPRPG